MLHSAKQEISLLTNMKMPTIVGIFIFIRWALIYWYKQQNKRAGKFNPCHAEPGYTLPLQTVYIQISWLLKKPTDLDLHCLLLSMWIFSNNPDQVIWLAEN